MNPIIPNKYFLDANIILDGCFVPFSWSRKAIEVLLHNGEPLFTGMNTIEETHRVLKKHCSDKRFVEYATKLQSAFLSAHNVTLINDVEGPAPNSVPKHDKYIYPTCRAMNLTLLTRDVSLLNSSADNDVDVSFPLEILTKGQPGHNYCFTGVNPSRHAGTIYFHGHNQHWDTDSDSTVHLWHATNILELSYLPGNTTWALSGSILKKDLFWKCKTPVAHGTDRKVALTWSNNELRLLDNTQNLLECKAEKVQLELPRELDLQVGGLKHQNFSGTIQALVVDDRPMSSKQWKKIKDRGFAHTPQPFDNDRLLRSLNYLKTRLTNCPPWSRGLLNSHMP